MLIKRTPESISQDAPKKLVRKISTETKSYGTFYKRSQYIFLQNSCLPVNITETFPDVLSIVNSSIKM